MGLLRLLKQSEDARKIFGARELKIIEKQLMGVVLTQSEKNRLSRDIRKKLDFINSVARFQDNFRLKKGAEVKRVVSETVDVLLTDVDSRKIKKIILYGSSVEGTRSLRSDIDIAVDIGNVNKKDATMFRKRVLGKLHSLVDVQILGTLPEKIRKKILSTGKIVYSR